MIDSIELVGFQDMMLCKTPLYSCIDSNIRFSYKFFAGHTYGLISDFGCGSWVVSEAVSGKTSETYLGKVIIDGTVNNSERLQNSSWEVGSLDQMDSLGLDMEKATINELIDFSLQLGKTDHSVESIKKIFCLSEERSKRSVSCQSGEIWLSSIAVGFSLGKQVFRYPWLNERNIFRYTATEKLGIIRFLKTNNAMIIIPTSQKDEVKKHCDHTIVFHKDGIATE